MTEEENLFDLHYKHLVEDTLKQVIDYESYVQTKEQVSKFKGELIHLILSHINPSELKWIEEHKTYPKNKVEDLYQLIGKILEQIKR